MFLYVFYVCKKTLSDDGLDMGYVDVGYPEMRFLDGAKQKAEINLQRSFPNVFPKH